MESKKTLLKSVKDTAEYFGCHENQIRLWLETGILKAIKIGKCQMISLEELERFIDRFYGYDISNINHIHETLEILKEKEFLINERN